MRKLAGGFVLGSVASLTSFVTIWVLAPRLAERGWL